MKIKKTKNKYIVRVMRDYKAYRLSFNYRPTKREIENKLNELQKTTNAAVSTNSDTLQETILKYIDIKRNVLSPTTLRSYYSTIKSLNKYAKHLLTLSIDNITNNVLQKFICDYSIGHRPKTCKNILSTITTPLKFFDNSRHFNIKTPMAYKYKFYIPTASDIDTLKKYYKGTDYETIFLLSLYGLRQSEIQALSINDFNPTTNELTINKAKVLDPNNHLVIKTTKTIDSNRTIILNDYLASLIKNQNYITKKSYVQFACSFNRVLKKLNIQHFSLHKLRHYFASELHRLNIPSKYIQQLGGWSSDHILKKVYTHTIENETKNFNIKINTILF